MSSQLPPSFEGFQPLAEAALSEWAPGAVVNFYSLKAGGLSGAAVIKVDITPTSTIDLEAGQYILKLCPHTQWTNQDAEASAHKRAEKFSPTFAEHHVPQLRRSFLPHDQDLGYAILYEIAGRNLESFIATDVRESPGFLDVCGDVTRDLLSSWVDESPNTNMTVSELAEAWLGYRLDVQQAPKLHEFADSLAGPRSRLFVVNDEVLPNPFAFLDFTKWQAWQPHPVFHGLEHGDLHGGNLLVHRRRPDNKAYWLIDFALSRLNPIGFDLAYLELSHILYCLGDSDLA